MKPELAPSTYVQCNQAFTAPELPTLLCDRVRDHEGCHYCATNKLWYDEDTRHVFALKETKNSETMGEFAEYCRTHPNERFWQALRNWSGQSFTVAGGPGWVEDAENSVDTFNWEGRDK